MALIDPAVAERVLARALAHGGEFAEVFAERRRGLSLSIDESRVESVQSGAEEGAGVRVLSGGTTYFAHVDGLDPGDLERAAAEAASALRGERAEPRPLEAVADRRRMPIERRPEDVPAERKADAAARARRARPGRRRRDRPALRRLRRGPPRGRGRQLRGAASAATTAPACGSSPRRWLAAATWSRPAPRRSAPTAASSCSTTTRRGSPSRPPRKALTLLDADPAPAGSMPVVVGGGFGGVLFHEMTGHGLEADHVQKGASVYEGKLGEQVAQPLLSAYDDGRLPGEWGSDAIDDEGTPTPENRW